MVILGVVRSFSGPVTRAILPQLVPEEHFQNAVAWNSSTNQSATILGPAAGGLIYAFFRGPSAVYTAAVCTGVIAVFATLRIRFLTTPRPREPLSVKTVLAGLH